MTQNEPIIPSSSVDASQEVVLSSEVSEVLSRTHRGADEVVELDRFAARESNPVIYYLSGVNSFALSILGMGGAIDPSKASHLIEMKERFRQREAGNNENFQKQA